jgi:hypothetical protein
LKGFLVAAMCVVSVSAGILLSAPQPALAHIACIPPYVHVPFPSRCVIREGQPCSIRYQRSTVGPGSSVARGSCRSIGATGIEASSARRLDFSRHQERREKRPPTCTSARWFKDVARFGQRWYLVAGLSGRFSAGKERQVTNDLRGLVRQGDVLLVPVDEQAPKGELVKWQAGRLVLAEGEATGHAHAIRARQTRLVRHARPTGVVHRWHGARTEQRLVLVVERPALLEHEEHDPIRVLPGVYEVRRQREYVPAGARWVRD